MTQFTDEKMPMSCLAARALFESEGVEDRLTVPEQEALDAHLAQCASCRSMHLLLQALPTFADAEDEGIHDAAITTVMHRLEAQRRADNRRILLFGGVLVAAMLLLGVALGMWRSEKQNGTPAEVPVAALPCVAVPAVEVVSGVFMTWCEGREPGTLIKDGAVDVTLRSGAVALSVDPTRQSRNPVSVHTAAGEVRVKGTIFAVLLSDLNDDARVEVFRGIVEVIATEDPTRPIPVSAGHGTRLNGAGVFPLTAPDAAELVDALPASPDEPVPASTPQVSETPEPAQPQPGDNNRLEKTGKPATASVGSLMADARTCLLAKNWECASSRYQQVLRQHPKTPEATAALISLAKIELRHRQMPHQALEHYRQYLRRAPDGPLAEEAMMGMADAHRALGQRDAEADALRRFVQKFPRSTMAPSARERLKKFESR